MIQVARRFWNFLKEDSWKSWAVSLVMAFLFIKLVFFPFLSFVFQSPLPLVVVESCSMYHESDFNSWWEQNKGWYEDRGITKEIFEGFSFRDGLNKGDIVLVSGRGKPNIGSIIIFNSNFTYPLIHRVIADRNKIETKGDHNGGQLSEEQNIAPRNVLGHAVGYVPGLGWLKLIFFEGLKSKEQRGFCR